MQVKIFTGGSTQEVMAQIKAELGSDAVILDSRNIQENGKKMVRMTAALDRIEPSAAPSPMPAPGLGSGSAFMGVSSGQQWMQEWHGIKRQMLALMKPAMRLDALEARQRAAMEFLDQAGAGDQALLELYRRIFDKPSASILEPLAELMPVKPWGFNEWPERVHLVAGPFGAGKTTTTVRLALALQKARAGTRICIVNADAERGNGRLLLKHYAGLSDIVYREASSAMEMAGVMGEIATQGFDRVIVDLPGVGRDQHLLDVLAAFALDRMDSVRMAAHLVFSPYYSTEMQARLLNRYRTGLPSSIIWSKLDECGQFGPMLNMAVASGLPISCFSFGPGLLNSLVPAKQPALWRLLFKHELPTANNTAAYE